MEQNSKNKKETTGVERMEAIVQQRRSNWDETDFSKLEQKRDTLADRRAMRYLNSFGYDAEENVVRQSGRTSILYEDDRDNSTVANRLLPAKRRDIVSDNLSSDDKIKVLALAPRHVWEN